MGTMALSKVIKSPRLKEKLNSYIETKLFGLNGIPQKIGQIKSMSSNVDKKNGFVKKSTASGSPIKLEEITVYLQKKHAKLWGCMENLSPALKSASLAQVHKAYIPSLHSTCAIKIQYPEVNEMLRVDGNMMNLITSSLKTFSKGFNTDEYARSISNELKEELDYNLEIEKQKQAFHLFRDQPQIIIPKPHPELSNSQVIIMDWEESMPVLDFIAIANADDKKELGKLFITFYLKALFEGGLIFSDPFPGNFGCRKNEQGELELVVYDYGSAIKLDEEKKINFYMLFYSIKNSLPYTKAILVNLGFKAELLDRIDAKLQVFMEMLLEPFLSEGQYDLSHWNRKERAEQILGEKRWSFMLAAPSDLMFVMRCFQGLIYYNQLLTGKIFCWNHLSHYLQNKQDKIMAALSFLSKDIYNQKISGYLNVEVFEGPRLKVKLELPRQSLEHIEDYISKEVLEILDENKVDLESIKAMARNTGYVPQALFSAQKGNSRYSVYLL